MGQTTANISIYIPSAGETNYAASFEAGQLNIDLHDHSGPPTGGVPISAAGLADGSVTYSKLNADVADNTTGIGTHVGGLANQLYLLGILNSLYNLGTDGVIVNTGGVASTIPLPPSVVGPIAITPTAVGQSVAGTTHYTFQAGSYTQIGKLVICSFNIEFDDASGSGNLMIGLDTAPVAVNNSSIDFTGSTTCTGLKWPDGATTTFVASSSNTNNLYIQGTRSQLSSIGFVQIAGETSVTIIGSIVYLTN